MADAYIPVSDVGAQGNLTLDIRDIGSIIAAAEKSQPVDWKAARAVYEKGGNSKRGDGSVRTLASVAANKAVLAQFPRAAELFDSPSFLDANVQAALNGTGRGRGVSERARRQLVDKGIQAILYGEILEELEAALAKVKQGNLDKARGAPHNMDEAWAYYAGAADAEGNRPYALSSTALKRERNFKLEGKLDTPLQRALASGLQAALKGDSRSLETAIGQARGYLNAIFYLASLRYASSLAATDDMATREIQLAEGWGFFQTIRPAVASASSDAATAVEAVYERPASKALPSGEVDTVYRALNSPPVLQTLAIPAALVIRSAP